MEEEYKKIYKEFLDEIDGDRIYPKDIFPEISIEDLKLINIDLQTYFGFPLDRLSAHIGRLILNGIKQKIMREKLGE